MPQTERPSIYAEFLPGLIRDGIRIALFAGVVLFTFVVYRQGSTRSVHETLDTLPAPSQNPAQPSFLSPIASLDTAALPVLRDVASVKALRGGDQFGHNVFIWGTVTYYNAEQRRLFVQDETGGIFVDAGPRHPLGLSAGDVVEIRARSDVGRFAPMLVDPAITFLEKGSLPAHAENRIEYLFAGHGDSEWSEVEGVVHAVRMENPGTAILEIVATGSRRLNVWLPQPDGKAPEQLVNAAIRVRGVCGPIFNGRRQLLGIRLLVPDATQIQVQRAGTTDPFTAPLVPIEELSLYSPEIVPGHLVRVRGSVIFHDDRARLYLDDGTRGVKVQLLQDSLFRVGDIVEVAGFPLNGSPYPILEDAVARKIGIQRQPEPTFVSSVEAATGQYHSQLIRVEGSLIHIDYNPEGAELTLQAGGNHFHAHAGWTENSVFAGSLRPGSVLQLTGVSVADESSSDLDIFEQSFGLLLRSPEDITVVQAAPWLTLNRLRDLLALTAILTLGITAMVVVLYRRVKRQAQIIRTKLETEEALKKEAQAANRAQSRFLSAVSHELRTPLTSILGYTDVLLEDEELKRESDQEQYLLIIQSSGQRLLGLVNDLLDLASAEAGKLQIHLSNVPADEPVYEVVRELRPLAEVKGIGLSATINCPSLLVRADVNRLRQVLTNLVSNAVKFTDAGQITIEVTETFMEQPGGQITPAVSYTVRDTGSGIAPEFIPKLFERFTQEQRGHRESALGTGLGLAITRELVTRMNGMITVSSELGTGSTFTVSLPAATFYPSAHSFARSSADART
jgi:signal transduction histidine kinase